MSLNRHACAALAELDGLGARGITPSEIVALHELGQRLDRAADIAVQRSAGLPVRCGSATLWPITCAGADWWDLARAWWRGRGALLAAAYGYCLAHGRDGAHMESLSTPDAAARAVRQWHRSLGATLAELDAACGAVEQLDTVASADSARLALAELLAWAPDRRAQIEALFPDLFPPRSADSEALGPVAGFAWRGYCAELAAICGGSPSEWYGRDLAETVRCYAVAAEAAAVKGGGSRKPGMAPDAVVTALRAMREEIAAILGRRKTES